MFVCECDESDEHETTWVSPFLLFLLGPLQPECTEPVEFSYCQLSSYFNNNTCLIRVTWSGDSCYTL